MHPAAAEAAIQNPLLDDVNLSGANGILVNITAGPDFTMAEFDEVGRTVENFASEDATVVIGTVLDPDMQDEVRVTVVATGLNRAVSRQSVRDRADFGMEATARKPQVQLIHTQGRRDGTTGTDARRDGRLRTRARTRASARACVAVAAANRRRPWPTSATTAATWTFRRSCAGRRTEPGSTCHASSAGLRRPADPFGRPAPRRPALWRPIHRAPFSALRSHSDCRVNLLGP